VLNQKDKTALNCFLGVDLEDKTALNCFLGVDLGRLNSPQLFFKC
jgi:hypothetical protein